MNRLTDLVLLVIGHCQGFALMPIGNRDFFEGLAYVVFFYLNKANKN
jgi:hypothetical protein